MDMSFERWQVETQGQIYQADSEELKQWISEGAVLITDKVKRGNLRWLPLGKVPELSVLFNAVDFDCNAPKISPASEDTKKEAEWEVNGKKACSLHEDTDAAYACVICKKLFCKICPNSHGSTVKLCPLCGALCGSANDLLENQKIIGAVNKPYIKADGILSAPIEANEFSTAKAPKILSYSLRFVKESISEAIASVSRSSSTLRR